MARVELDDDWFDNWSQSADAELAMQRVAEQAQTMWEEASRKLTGRMAHNTIATAVDDGDGFEGLLVVLPYYAAFQEYGTEEIEGQRVFEEIRMRLEP